jgi:hypothetical protein
MCPGRVKRFSMLLLFKVENVGKTIAARGRHLFHPKNSTGKSSKESRKKISRNFFKNSKKWKTRREANF